MLVTALVWAWRSGDRDRVIALVLIVCGGIGLHSTYQSTLVVAGLALLVVADRRSAEGPSALVAPSASLPMTTDPQGNP